jgi:hypothetical protein
LLIHSPERASPVLHGAGAPDGSRRDLDAS